MTDSGVPVARRVWARRVLLFLAGVLVGSPIWIRAIQETRPVRDLRASLDASRLKSEYLIRSVLRR